MSPYLRTKLREFLGLAAFMAGVTIYEIATRPRPQELVPAIEVKSDRPPPHMVAVWGAAVPLEGAAVGQYVAGVSSGTEAVLLSRGPSVIWKLCLTNEGLETQHVVVRERGRFEALLSVDLKPMGVYMTDLHPDTVGVDLVLTLERAHISGPIGQGYFAADREPQKVDYCASWRAVTLEAVEKARVARALRAAERARLEKESRGDR